MKRIAVLQSSYIPWKGFFDIIHSVDEFVWYDDVKFTRCDWRSRNRIKTHSGLLWLTVPCFKKGSPLIQEVSISNRSWQKKHWKTISQSYHKAPYFPLYCMFFEELYLGRQWESLSEMNRHFVENICSELLGVHTRFLNSADYDCEGKKQEKLLNLLNQVEADIYLSGPSAKGYIDEADFNCRGIQLEWMDYTGYPEYPQQFGKFEHAVSILDLIFNTGPDAPWYIWGWRNEKLKMGNKE